MSVSLFTSSGSCSSLISASSILVSVDVAVASMYVFCGILMLCLQLQQTLSFPSCPLYMVIASPFCSATEIIRFRTIKYSVTAFIYLPKLFSGRFTSQHHYILAIFTPYKVYRWCIVHIILNSINSYHFCTAVRTIVIRSVSIMVVTMCASPSRVSCVIYPLALVSFFYGRNIS